MKITIFGTWYVWLVTGTCLAEVGHEVMCIDIDQNKIDKLKEGIIPIYEPGLEELVKRNYKEGRLLFSTDAKTGIDFATAIFSAVGTPPDENHRADLRFVKIVAETVGKHMDDYKVFINKSTVPVGTGEMCKNIIKQELEKRNSPLLGGDLEGGFDVVSNPEFLKEWAAVKDFMTPDRIVCGVESEQAKKVMNDIYKSFIRADKPLVFTDLKSSEIIKYAANAFLATKISFINEIANFSEIVGANISDISKWIGLDPRIGSKFLHAGIGYGGSCFPKDVQALIETGKDFNYDFKIIKATEQVNKIQKVKIVDMLLDKIPDLSWKTIAIWWLAFKPKTDDIRDAPSLDIIERLIGLWVSKIKAFDPVAMENVSRIFENQDKLTLTFTNYDALKWADALLVLTEWDEFRNADFDKIATLMKWNIIIDGRNIWNKDDLLERGFVYEWIGK